MKFIKVHIFLKGQFTSAWKRVMPCHKCDLSPDSAIVGGQPMTSIGINRGPTHLEASSTNMSPSHPTRPIKILGKYAIFDPDIYLLKLDTVPRQQAPRLRPDLKEEVELQARELGKRIDIGDSTASKLSSISQATVSGSSRRLMKLLVRRPHCRRTHRSGTRYFKPLGLSAALSGILGHSSA